MGTRNLTALIYKGEPRIAQYGQWDGYPQGQGYTILDFLLSADISVLKEKVERYVSFIDEEKDKQFIKDVDACANWDKIYPYLSRDMGGKIFEYVYNLESPIKLFNKFVFASDSLFCEYAYVIDLDKNTFEVYQGFNNKKLTKTARFYSMMDLDQINKDAKHRPSGEKYYPVKLITSFKLNKLPKTHKEFIERLNKKMSEDSQFRL